MTTLKTLETTAAELDPLARLTRDIKTAAATLRRTFPQAERYPAGSVLKPFPVWTQRA